MKKSEYNQPRNNRMRYIAILSKPRTGFDFSEWW